MEHAEKEALIRTYIRAYNHFDLPGMLAGLHPDIIFENRSGAELTMRLEGLAAFEKQAAEALSYFSNREQQIAALRHIGSSTEIDIIYRAVAAADLSSSLKKGDRLEMDGRSVFTFSEGKIASITDIS
ncbi:nuclear transport factor 2 family protein [Pedobacter yulinensis]|nr:nuclear transport factor 2 family protein [Pedobacter yulinensis]